MLIKLLARYVHSQKTFIRIDFAVELQHLLHVLGVNQEVLGFLVVVLRDGERRVDVDLSAVDGSQKGSHHDVSLVLRLTEVVIQDVWSNRRMD